MTKFFNWVARSSADPTQVALTVRGLVSGWLPLAMFFLHNPNLSTLPDDIYSIILGVFTVYSTCATVFGLARKIAYTVIPEKTQ